MQKCRENEALRLDATQERAALIRAEQANQAIQQSLGVCQQQLELFPHELDRIILDQQLEMVSRSKLLEVEQRCLVLEMTVMQADAARFASEHRLHEVPNLLCFDFQVSPSFVYSARYKVTKQFEVSVSQLFALSEQLRTNEEKLLGQETNNTELLAEIAQLKQRAQHYQTVL